MAQRRYHHYGNNHQGLETPDGIIVEMHGPFEGQTHDMRMLREFRLLERALLHCTCLSYLAAPDWSPLFLNAGGPASSFLWVLCPFGLGG